MTAKAKYLITPTLLNSWGYLYYCPEEYTEKAYNDFLNTLGRVKTEPTEAMLKGIKYEDDTYKGLTPASEIVKDGCYQVVGTKDVTIDDMDFLMYGRLDVLKGGIIYDIKCVSRYERPKYSNSYQHEFYLELFPEAKYFEYLIDNGQHLYKERYYKGESREIEQVIREFITYLKTNNLLEKYKELWRTKDE